MGYSAGNFLPGISPLCMLKFGDILCDKDNPEVIACFVPQNIRPYQYVTSPGSKIKAHLPHHRPDAGNGYAMNKIVQCSQRMSSKNLLIWSADGIVNRNSKYFFCRFIKRCKNTVTINRKYAG